MLRASRALRGASLLLVLVACGLRESPAAEPQPLFVPPTPIGPLDAAPPGLFDPLPGSPPTPVPTSTEPVPYFDYDASTPAPTPSCGVRYWIVSSRCAPQHICDVGRAGLQVFASGCDGCLRPGSCAALQRQLHPGAPVMVFMHGAYVDWESNLEQSELTYRWIRCACPGRPLNVIFFTWPSDQTRLLLAACELRQLGAAAEANAFYVASLLACIPDCHPICLVGHSFGARMALATTHLIAGGAIQGRRLACAVGCKRIRVVLAAAAVDHNWLNDCQRFELAACYAEGILNLVNRQDCILKFYPLLRLFSRRALGSVGQTPIDRNRLSCACKVQNCNVTGLVGHGHFWPNYYRSPQIARILAPWVYFPEAAVTYPAMSSAAAAHAAPEEAALQASHALEPTPLDAEVELHTAVPVSQVRPAWTRGSTSMRSEPEYRPIRAWLSSL